MYWNEIYGLYGISLAHVSKQRGKKNLQMTGRKWNHSCGNGAMCQTEVGLQQNRVVTEAQRWAGIHHHSRGWKLTIWMMAVVEEMAYTARGVPLEVT